MKEFVGAPDDKSDEEDHRLEKLAETLKITIAQRNAKIGELNATIAQRDTEIGNLNEKYNDLNDAFIRAGQRVGNLNAAINENTKQIKKLERTQRSLQTQIGEKDKLLKMQKLLMEQFNKSAFEQLSLESEKFDESLESKENVTNKKDVIISYLEEKAHQLASENARLAKQADMYDLIISRDQTGIFSDTAEVVPIVINFLRNRNMELQYKLQEHNRLLKITTSQLSPTTCCICLEQKLIEKFNKNCDHKLCKACIDKLFGPESEFVGNGCPQCRSGVDLTDNHKLCVVENV